MNISTSVKIQKKPEDLFPWIADPAKARQWQKNVENYQILHETSETIGTTFIEEINENGKCLIMHGEITDFIPNELIGFHLESKIHRLDAIFRISDHNSDSVLSGIWKIHWKFPMNAISIIFGRKMEQKILKQAESEFAELKRLCEQ